MKSTRRTLEEAVITAARDVEAMRLIGSTVERLTSAVRQLDAYLGTLEGPSAFSIGSHTSENAAARMIIPLRVSLRRKIIDEIRTCGFALGDRRGLTDQEMEHRLHREHSSVSSARNYLVEYGWLRDTGFVRPNRSGRDAVVWGLTPAAWSMVRSPEWGQP